MQITIDKQTIRRYLPFIATTLLFLVFLINDPHWFWVEAWFLLEIVILTTFTRTLSLKHGALALLGGIFLGFGAVYIIGSIMDLGGIEGGLRSFLMPPIEEIAKLLPLLIVIMMFGSIKRPRLNLSDFLFIGTCAGTGFSMLEKYFWSSVYFPFTYGPHINSAYFFPDALGVYAGGGQFGYIGHAAATAFVALGIGASYMLLKKKKAYWLAPGVFAFAWISIEHIILNYYYSPGGEAITLFGGGMWTPWIVLIAIIAALMFDLGKLRAYLMNTPKLMNELMDEMLGNKKKKTFTRTFKLIRAANYLAWVKTK